VVVVVVQMELSQLHITMALAVLMGEVLEVLLIAVLGQLVLLLEKALCVSFGPVAPEHSHQLVQVTNNESIY
jgi:hypothetical protein